MCTNVRSAGRIRRLLFPRHALAALFRIIAPTTARELRDHDRLHTKTPVELAAFVVQAVPVEKRSVREVARAHGISKTWLYELLARYLK